MTEFFESFAPSVSTSPASSTTTTPPQSTTTPITGPELESMAIKELLATIKFNKKVLMEVRDMVILGGDADYANAFASVSKANADAIQKLTELALQKEKIAAQKEIKEMDIESKKQLLEQKHSLDSKHKVTNNNFLVMGREDVFNKLFNGSIESKEKIITGEVQDDVPSKELILTQNTCEKDNNTP